MSDGPEHLTLHRVTRTNAAPWIDPWGREHRDTVDILETLELDRTDDTVEYSNGYEDLTGDVYIAADGRRFHRYVGIDYHNNVRYVPLDADTAPGSYWVQRLDRGTRWMLNGEPHAPWLNEQPQRH